MKNSIVAVLAIAFSVGATNATIGGTEDKAAKAQAAINAYIQTHPEMIIDFSKVSGEYCVNTWKVGGGHMTHYAIDPSKTTEDLIDFVKAQSFVDGGIDVTKLRRMPDTLGTMKNGQWYYLPKGAAEPHHGSKAFPLALIVRSSDIQ